MDTRAISEIIPVKPNSNVLEWFQSQPELSLYLSIITIADIEKGTYQLAQGKRRRVLKAWLLDQLSPSFQGRVLEIDRKLIKK